MRPVNTLARTSGNTRSARTKGRTFRRVASWRTWRKESSTFFKLSVSVSSHIHFHPSRRHGFTLVELLIVIAILAVLAGVLAPVGRGMISRSQTVNCSQNLRQIGMAAIMYAGDNHMTLPATSHQRGGRSWTLTLQPYASGTITFKCANDPDTKRSFTYAINDFLTPNPSGAAHLNFSILAKIERPEATFMFAEAAVSHRSDHFHFAPYHGGRVPPVVFERQVGVSGHDDKANYLFADGHVETLSRREVRARLGVVGGRFIDPSAR